MLVGGWLKIDRFSLGSYSPNPCEQGFIRMRCEKKSDRQRVDTDFSSKTLYFENKHIFSNFAKFSYRSSVLTVKKTGAHSPGAVHVFFPSNWGFFTCPATYCSSLLVGGRGLGRPLKRLPKSYFSLPDGIL